MSFMSRTISTLGFIGNVRRSTSPFFQTRTIRANPRSGFISRGFPFNSIRGLPHQPGTRARSGNSTAGASSTTISTVSENGYSVFSVNAARPLFSFASNVQGPYAVAATPPSSVFIHIAWM